MQIESLKMFCDLAETSSFTKAAQINEVTQSAVSQTITTLERHFACLLVERSKKNFRLTPEGQVLYDHAKRILEGYGAMLSKLQEIEGVVTGDIRVSTIYSIGLHELPPHLKTFREHFPDVELHVEYRRSQQVYAQVLSGDVDLGLVAFPAKRNGLQIEIFSEDQLVLICHPNHSLAKRQQIRIEELLSLIHI